MIQFSAAAVMTSFSGVPAEMPSTATAGMIICAEAPTAISCLAWRATTRSRVAMVTTFCSADSATTSYWVEQATTGCLVNWATTNSMVKKETTGCSVVWEMIPSSTVNTTGRDNSLSS